MRKLYAAAATGVVAALGCLSLSLAGRAPGPVSCKLQAPIEIVLRPLEVRPELGRYRVELEIGLQAPLAEVHRTVALPAGARLLDTQQRVPLQLKAGQPARREQLLIQAPPGQGVRLSVSVRGKAGSAVLVRTGAIELGPVESPQGLEGRVRTDHKGRTFLQVPAQPAAEVQ
jgi:hypothetical protein